MKGVCHHIQISSVLGGRVSHLDMVLAKQERLADNKAQGPTCFYLPTGTEECATMLGFHVGLEVEHGSLC